MINFRSQVSDALQLSEVKSLEVYWRRVKLKYDSIEMKITITVSIDKL